MGQFLSTPSTEISNIQGNGKNILYYGGSIQGWRCSMEDKMITEVDINDKMHFFSVLDGHGGDLVVKYVESNFINFIKENELYNKDNFHEKVKKIYIDLDDALRSDILSQYPSDSSGSAASSVCIFDNDLYCVNIGDSRTVISTNGMACALSIDHKPNCLTEAKRIEEDKGFISENRVNGILALSRAFGDFGFKILGTAPEKMKVCVIPDIFHHNITEDNEFILIACDGLWDVLTNQQAVDFVRYHLLEKLDPEEIVNLLLKRCISPMLSVGVGCDNVSILLIILQPDINLLYQKVQDYPLVGPVSLTFQSTSFISK